MCGHGTIGVATVLVETGMVEVTEPVTSIRLDTPAGLVVAEVAVQDGAAKAVTIRNVPSYSVELDAEVKVPGLGVVGYDLAYGGNFYAIVEPQPHYAGLDSLSAGDIQRLSPLLRSCLNDQLEVVHPEDPTIRGVSHIQWTGPAHDARAHGRNAVFYGASAIDRSPCGTGTSARLAQLAARGDLGVGDVFVHESIIGSLFEGRVEATARVGEHPAIVPSVAGWARLTGLNTIFVDPRDPYAHGFQLT
jgi:4-hydroxyproline epimerase